MLHPHYPLHYALTRPYARAALKDVQLGQESAAALDVHGIASRRVLSYLQESGWSPKQLSVFAQETQGLLVWLEWALKGQELWTVAPELSAAFERSDCGDLRVMDVLEGRGRGTVYIHFDEKGLTPLKLNDSGAILEGAYVVYYPESLRVVLCSRLSPNCDVSIRGNERYDLRIPSAYLELPADEAIELALEDDIKDLDNAQAQLKERGADPGQAALLKERMVNYAPAFKQALRLVLCALAYRKAYPEEAEDGWTPGAPARMTRMAEAGTPKEKARAKSKLWAQGHIPVLCLGESFHVEETGDAQSSVRLHWRSGHWRHQAYGQGHTLRKLLWIRPMKVGRTSST